VTYAVRWIEPAQIRDEHLDVWRRNLLLNVDPARRFDWLYRDNPAGPGRLALLTADSDDATTVVGTAGYGRRNFHVAGRDVDGAVLADMAVDRIHRTALPALTLARSVRSQALDRYALVYGFPNKHAAPLLRRAGYRMLGEMRRFALVLRHRTHVQKRLAGHADPRVRLAADVAAPIAGTALDLLRAAVIAKRAFSAFAAYRMDIRHQADAHFDRLWEVARQDYPMLGVRNADFVRWRFLSCPERPIDLVTVTRRQTGELAGYAAILRQGMDVHLHDFFAPRISAEPFLRLLCALFLARGMRSISFRFFGAPWLVACLGRLGFRERAERRDILIDAGPTFSGDHASLCQGESWFITDADEDA
jgi:hypothetical protein